MIVRLHNLSVRPPRSTDLEAVAALLVACALAVSEVTGVIEEEIEKTWHAPGFVLKADAWVIVTKRGKIVGYADVRRSREHQLTALLHVHPDYLGRGIGTLLVWLTEERARHLLRTMPLDQAVTLINIVSSLNTRARDLFEREGYTLTRSFWSLLIQAEEGMDAPFDAFEQGKRISINLGVGVQNFVGTPHLVARTGIYAMCQYNLFEKVLRTAQVEQAMEAEFAGV